jgi:hypothetical protein
MARPLGYRTTFQLTIHTVSRARISAFIYRLVFARSTWSHFAKGRRPGKDIGMHRWIVSGCRRVNQTWSMWCQGGILQKGRGPRVLISLGKAVQSIHRGYLLDSFGRFLFPTGFFLASPDEHPLECTFGQRHDHLGTIIRGRVRDSPFII